MTEKHYVVIGNGPAGNEAAFTLRKKAPNARISVISKARESCYLPHLLPDFIAGKIQEEQMYVCSFDACRDQSIKVRCCQEVVALDLQKYELLLQHKELLPFDGLIIAVGGKPRIPERLWVFQDLMYTLKTLEDAKIWIDKLSQVDSVLIIGGDLISLALIKALIHLRKNVYCMLNDDAFWPLRGSQDLLARVAESLRQQGVEVLMWRDLQSMERLPDNTYRVEMNDSFLQVGVVGAFFGLVPDVRFLASSGLRIDRGVLVDEYLNTGFPGVFATGDCAQIYHPEICDYWVSIGHENAQLLGRVAAMNLVGGELQAEVQPESIFSVQGINVSTSWWTEI